ncbi:S-methyl-5-thioribose-1-phosphate isomerase [Patescibacteria group bacterium]
MPNIDQFKKKLPLTIEIFADYAQLIDQRKLPRKLVREKITSLDQALTAIKDMHIRGAQAIEGCGIAGMILAAREAKGSVSKIYIDLEEAAGKLIATRPTAVNLSWAVRKMLAAAAKANNDVAEVLWVQGQELFAAEIQNNVALGEHGAELITEGMTLQTHCNAGSLSSLWYGTATAPMFSACLQNKKFSVIVDETRPRLQGARLTAWELEQVGIDYAVVTDSSCGALLGKGKIDAVIVGADRIAANGDVANKIGTYPLALMAYEHSIPFYVAASESTIDPTMSAGVNIPIEERSREEYWGYLDSKLIDNNMPVLNIAFDVTPAKYVTKIITEKGVKDPIDIAN